MDRITKAQRSAVMARVKGKDTSPELFVRHIVTKMGYRYRLHRRDLPGTPDLVFPGLRKVIFIHGCFWHAHQCRHGRRIPKTNHEYWVRKRRRNAARDRAAARKLTTMGWDVLVLWECELASQSAVTERLGGFLNRKKAIR